MEYKQDVAFVNRDVELDYIKDFLDKKPSEILFIYGPKSSGKTTLLFKLGEQIEIKRKYDIHFLDLRRIWLGSYKDFIRAFFNVIDEDDKKTKNKIEISAGIFKINRETEKKLLKVEADPFKVMENKLVTLNKKGKRPIIVIDELQELQEIYINGQRQLVNELFNFFVAITKESHLAHIVISSSDGYFIESVYEHSRLRKTSKFFKVDYLAKEDVGEWLNNLLKYSQIKDLVLTEDQIEEIWNFLGGSCWEIQSLLSDIMFYGFEKAITQYKKEKASDVINAVAFNSDKEQVLSLFKDAKQLRGNEVTQKLTLPEDKIKGLLSELVTQDILFFDPVKAFFAPASKSVEFGIDKYF